MITKNAQEYLERVFVRKFSEFAETDPEFDEILQNFANDEVIGKSDLDEETRFTVILAALLGCQGKEEFEVMLQGALNIGIAPTLVKEIVYQAVAYLGIGRVLPFIRITNKVLRERGYNLPLVSQKTVSELDRQEKGTEAQVEIFGEGMKDFYKAGNDRRKNINYWLAANCFGDYYTRSGLDLKTRELITFCFLAAQGGCEPQLISHCAGNIAMGNDKDFLIDVVTQLVPYLGYPRCLNALTAIDKATEN